MGISGENALFGGAKQGKLNSIKIFTKPHRHGYQIKDFYLRNKLYLLKITRDTLFNKHLGKTNEKLCTSLQGKLGNIGLNRANQPRKRLKQTLIIYAYVILGIHALLGETKYGKMHLYW